MSEKKRRKTGWDDVPSQGNDSNFYDCYDPFNFKDDYEAIRLVGDVVTIEIGWIPALKKGGKGDTAFPVMSLSNDGKPCPLKEAGIKTQTLTLSNAIIRSIQENLGDKLKQPKKKFREKGDKFKSPVRVVKLPNGPANKIKNLKSLNKVRTNKGFKTFHINDSKYGIDVLVLYDKNQSGSAMYEIQKDERTPLTKNEQQYLLYDLEKVFDAIPEREDIIEKIKNAYEKNLFDKKNCNLSALRKLISFDGEIDEDEDDEDFSMNKKNKKKTKSNKKNKKNNKNKRDYDEYEDDEDELEDVEDEDIDDEDELEDEDEFDDVDDDFDDEDEDDEEDLDDDEEDDDEEEEDLDEEEEEEEEERKPKRSVKKKGKKKEKSKKKKGKKRRSKDEDEDDDEDY